MFFENFELRTNFLKKKNGAKFLILQKESKKKSKINHKRISSNKRNYQVVFKSNKSPKMNRYQ